MNNLISYGVRDVEPKLDSTESLDHRFLKHFGMMTITIRTSFSIYVKIFA